MSDWKDVLAPTPECIDIARFDALTDADRAHLETCVRCQTELALFREMMSEETSPASQWIAGRLTMWSAEAAPPLSDRANRKVEALPPHSKRRSAFLALAAALAIVIGLGTWMQMREPSIDTTTTGTYRSARVELVTPAGDLTHAPNELRWTNVPKASRYRVRILEVDGTVVWSGETTGTHVALPPDVIAQFKPGKSLRWEVQAFRGTEMLASSETQTVRVNP